MKQTLACILFGLWGQSSICVTPFITSIKMDPQHITYYVDEQFHAAYLREDFFVMYQHDIDLTQLDYTIITMPLIMNTIGMIWVSGNDYSIKAMDCDLYESLEKVRSIFKRFYPATQFNGNLIPEKLIKNNLPNSIQPGIALPFSHGLDSLCTSLRLRATPQLLITARGYSDTPIGSWNKNWEYTQTLIGDFAKTHGHTCAFIASNFHEFFNWAVLSRVSPDFRNWRMNMIEGLGWMGLTAPILATKGYTTFVLPANNDWKTPHPGADCPLIVENIIFAGIHNVSDGFDLTRLEKNKVVAQICNDNNLEKPLCVICERILENRRNCCECQKCAASILSFLLLGEDPCEYGFTIRPSVFLNFFKSTFIHNNKYEPYPASWFKYCQELSRATFDQLRPELQEFFTWYNTIDFDSLTLPTLRVTLNYNDFTDVYSAIPMEILNQPAERKTSC